MSYAPSLDDIQKFLAKTGKRGARTLSMLGQLSGFITALQTEVGFELLKDDVARHDALFVKIYNMEADDKEKAEFRVLKDRLQVTVKRISLYLEKHKEIETAIKFG